MPNALFYLTNNSNIPAGVIIELCVTNEIPRLGLHSLSPLDCTVSTSYANRLQVLTGTSRDEDASSPDTR